MPVLIRQRRAAAILLAILGLTALRVEPPGKMFYEAFHMLPWYGLFIGATALLLGSIRPAYLRRFLVAGFIGFSVLALFWPSSFLWERVDRMREFDSQYAKYTHYSQAIRAVAAPGTTLFLDLWDDVIYWESGLPSSYPYSLYIPVASALPRYQLARERMFIHTPPDIYYSCPNLAGPRNSLPHAVKDDYVPLMSGATPGCLYLKQSLVSRLTHEQRSWLTAHGFSIGSFRL